MLDQEVEKSGINRVGDIQWWSYWWDGKEGLKNGCMHVIIHTRGGVCGVSCMSTDVSEFS